MLAREGRSRLSERSVSRLDSKQANAFESRELKPHAEPIVASDLKEGSIYFAGQFIDEEILNPTLEPLAFVGRDLEPDDPGGL